jgi:hypothetical protein
VATPAEQLQTLIAGLDDLPAGLNIYAAPTDKIVAPAIVIRPGPQWMAQDSFCFALERYAVMPVVTASTPLEGIAMLRSLSLAIIGALESPWDWESVDGPVIDETTGVPFLANRVNLTYRGSEG